MSNLIQILLWHEETSNAGALYQYAADRLTSLDVGILTLQPRLRVAGDSNPYIHEGYRPEPVFAMILDTVPIPGNSVRGGLDEWVLGICDAQ